MAEVERLQQSGHAEPAVSKGPETVAAEIAEAAARSATSCTGGESWLAERQSLIETVEELETELSSQEQLLAAKEESWSEEQQQLLESVNMLTPRAGAFNPLGGDAHAVPAAAELAELTEQIVALAATLDGWSDRPPIRAGSDWKPEWGRLSDCVLKLQREHNEVLQVSVADSCRCKTEPIPDKSLCAAGPGQLRAPDPATVFHPSQSQGQILPARGSRVVDRRGRRGGIGDRGVAG